MLALAFKGRVSMRWRSGPGLVLVAIVIVALGVLAVSGRMLGLDSAVPSTSTQAPTLTSTAVEPVETSTSRGVLVPNAVGKSLAEGRRLMRRAGLRGAAIETDPQAPTSRIFGPARDGLSGLAVGRVSLRAAVPQEG